MQLSTVPYIMLLLVYPKMRWPLITPQSDTTDTTHSLAIADFQLFPVSAFQLFPVSAFQPLLVLVVKHLAPLPYITNISDIPALRSELNVTQGNSRLHTLHHLLCRSCAEHYSRGKGPNKSSLHVLYSCSSIITTS